MNTIRCTAVLLLALLCQSVAAAVIWVSPAGDDAAEGTQTAPKATVTAALRAAREMRRKGEVAVGETVTIRLTGGVHRLYEPVFIRPEDSGTPDSPTVIECDEPVGEEVRSELAGLSGVVRFRYLNMEES